MKNVFSCFLLVLSAAIGATADVVSITPTATVPFALSVDVDAENPAAFARTGYVEYVNEGTISIPAPYVRLTSEKGTELRFSSDDQWGTELELLAVSTNVPASKLEPGEKRRIPFQYRSFGKAVSIEFGYATGNSKPFPWNANEPRMRPSWIADDAWNLCLSRLKANIGTTWNGYLDRMRADADHFARLGENVFRLDRLWQVEAGEALGADRAMPVLEESTDLERPARGFGLAFTRSYRNSVESRLSRGVLGFGWSDNYAAWADLTDGGRTLGVHAGTGGSYYFRKIGGAWVPENPGDKTKVSETDGEYVFVHPGGLEQRIGKSVMRTTSISDRQGNALRFSYDGEGRLVRVAHVDGPFLEFSYRDGLLSEVSDDLGRKSTYEYDGGMLVCHVSFDGLKTRYRYLPEDRTANSRALRQIVRPDGNREDFSYDGRGRLATISANGGSMLAEIRHGRLGSFTVVSPDGAETRVKMGSAGQPLEAVNALGEKTTFRYTAGNLLSSVVGPTGKSALLSYDADGRPVAAKDPLGSEMRFGYDGEDRVSSVTDARGNAYRFGYDSMGRGESFAFGDGPAMHVEYTERGDVSKWVNRRGQAVSMAYDSTGRPVSAKWDSGRTFAWAYDARGNCIRAEDSETGAVVLEYDSLDRPVRIVHPGNRGFTYEYDAFGRMLRRTSFEGDIQQYEYDALGRLVRMTDGAGGSLLENVYEEATGRLARQRFGNGTSTAYAYDILGRATRIDHFAPDGTVLGFFAYEYDADGNRVSQTTEEGVERYEYDANGQLVVVSYPDGSTERFAYDAVGNRVSANGTVYETDSRNQIVKTVSPDGTETLFSYDADGNLVRKVAPGGDATEYSYDIHNRLVAVKNAGKGIDWSCKYDVFGNRVAVTDHGRTTERLYAMDGIPSVASEYENGRRTVRHVLLAGLVLADIGADGGETWHHVDAIASIRIATDGNGKRTASASFRAFGEIRASEGNMPSTDWIGGCGVERDATGLVFLRNRNFDPTLGRFVQQDPIGLAGGQINLYAYCGNTPVMGVDFLGLYNWCYFWRDLNTVSNGLGTVLGIVGIGAAIVLGGATAPVWLAWAGVVVAATALVSNLVYMLAYKKEFNPWSFAGDVVNLGLSFIGLKGVFKLGQLEKISVPELRRIFPGQTREWYFAIRKYYNTQYLPVVNAARTLWNMRVDIVNNAIQTILSGWGTIGNLLEFGFP